MAGGYYGLWRLRLAGSALARRFLVEKRGRAYEAISCRRDDSFIEEPLYTSYLRIPGGVTRSFPFSKEMMRGDMMD